MHAFTIRIEAIERLGIADWLAIEAVELERVATALLDGRRGRRWVRHGDEFAVIASLKLGCVAAKIPAELSELAAETRRILTPGGTDAVLRAAAFYHLRFEIIHPLGEGNGRVGRTILAAQLHETLRIPVEETMNQFNAHENDYKIVFPAGDERIMFELMLDVLARLSGHVVGDGANALPASILPLYPDRRPLIRHSTQKLRPMIAPRRTPSRGRQPFRKFR